MLAHYLLNYVTLFLVHITVIQSIVYTLKEDITAANFEQSFDFITNSQFVGGEDPTHGYVNYVNLSDAKKNGLFKLDNNLVHLGVDQITNLTATGNTVGRDSIRVHSKNSYSGSFLVVYDAPHQPTTTMGPLNSPNKRGCSVWPAFWTSNPPLADGSGSWPDDGEIDIVEYANFGSVAVATLHVGPKCSLSGNENNHGSGNWTVFSNCGLTSNPYNGCGINSNNAPIGHDFNQNMDAHSNNGVFVTELKDNEYIRVFYFAFGAFPIDLSLALSQGGLELSPDSNSWGQPFANFSLKDCQNAYKDQKIIINTAFCGDWAGEVFGQCDGTGSSGVAAKTSCRNYVASNPSVFSETYWSIKSIKVFTPKEGSRDEL